MKKFRHSLLVLPLLTIIFFSPSYAKSDFSTIRILSFNMEGWNHQYDMQSNYTKLFIKPQLVNNVPDFIATQENFSRDHQHGTYVDFIAGLNTEIPSAQFEQYGRARGSLTTPEETNAIIYRKARWQLIPQVAQIQNTLHTIYNSCDPYVNNNNLTCQLVVTTGDYARIMTWGIFQEKANLNNIVIFTSTHQSLNGSDRVTEQQQVAAYTNKLVDEAKRLFPQAKITVVMAGDYNTTDFNVLYTNLSAFIKGGRNAPYNYLVHPDVIFSNTANSNMTNYFQTGAWVTDHGPIGETVELNN